MKTMLGEQEKKGVLNYFPERHSEVEMACRRSPGKCSQPCTNKGRIDRLCCDGAALEEATAGPGNSGTGRILQWPKLNQGSWGVEHLHWPILRRGLPRNRNIILSIPRQTLLA
jgi:hypothetical protein